MAHGRDGDLKGRLSRKIAELTMVVHLLFTRNHEREIEIDAIKAAYEHEIRVVQEEMKGKISWVEGQLDDLEKYRVLLDLKATESEKDKQFIKQLQEKETELKAAIEQKEHLLGLAEKEIINLKEQLVNKLKTDDEQVSLLTGQLENLRKENSELQSKTKSRSQKLKKCQDHIEELKAKNAKLKTEFEEVISENNKLKTQLDGLEVDWQEEINQLKKTISELTKKGEEDKERVERLEWKNKQLSQHGKDLEDENRQLELRIQQIINERNKKKPKQRNIDSTPEVPRTSPEVPLEVINVTQSVNTFIVGNARGPLSIAP